MVKKIKVYLIFSFLIMIVQLGEQSYAEMPSRHNNLSLSDHNEYSIMINNNDLSENISRQTKMNFNGYFLFNNVTNLNMDVFFKQEGINADSDINNANDDNENYYEMITDNNKEYSDNDNDVENIEDELSITNIENNEVLVETNIEIDSDIDLETNTEINIDYPTERGIYLVKDGMPKNTRHLKEGYWIGSLPDVSNIDSIKQKGIKVILTVTNVKKGWNPVKRKIEESGLEHIIIPVGSRFPKDTSFYDVLLQYDPNEIFVHCDHGGDRSGTFIAYLLARHNHWSIQRALLAMVNPSSIDIKGVISVLNKYGIYVSDEDRKFIGIYSGADNNGFGGLKARNDDYKRLVSTMIEMFLVENI